MTLGDFAPGDRVVLARVKNPDYVGKHGTVRKTIKRDQTVIIVVDDDDPAATPLLYRADPQNLDREP